MKTARC